jgi:hypothetical protein
VRRFCDKTILLKQGVLVDFGDTSDVIGRYIHDTTPEAQINAVVESSTGDTEHVGSIKRLSCQGENEAKSTEDVEKLRKMNDRRWGNKKIEITDVKFVDKNGKDGDHFIAGEPFTIQARYTAKEYIIDPVFGFDIYDDLGNYCYATNSLLKDVKIDHLEGEGILKIHIEELPLLQGKYFMSIAVQSSNYRITYDWQNKKYIFYVVNNDNDQGFIMFKCNFEVC